MMYQTDTLHTELTYLHMYTHTCIYMTATYTKAHENGNTHPIIYTRITNCTDRFYSDCALSVGLELTDAQADYSAFSGHMT